MDKIIFLLLLGLAGWWIGNMTAGQVGYEQLLDLEPSRLDMIVGIVGSSVSSYLFLFEPP